MDNLLLILVSCSVFVLHTQVQGHPSSGRLIIDTAKHAFEEAKANRTHRLRRSLDDHSLTLQSLLIKDQRNNHLIEYDLILDDDQYGQLNTIGEKLTKKGRQSQRQKRKAVRHSIYHWPGAVMPYQIHPSVDLISSQARFRIKKAMKHWEDHTCIQFVEYDRYKHTNYVVIEKGTWCASKLGMSGGAQPLYLALGCLDTGTIIHELGHTLGWVHEQARPDRDQYVTIKWDLVAPGYKSQYVKHDEDFVNTFDVPYDYGSIMHYPSYGELLTNDRSAQRSIGQRNRLSFYDIKLANIMYQCPERAKCDTTRVQCTDEGFLDKSCKCVCKGGNFKSCTSTNPLATRVTPSPEVGTRDCISGWHKFDNSYIPGFNDDVGFSLSVTECKTRCERETRFTCQSFDYWEQRRQCYLSSKSITGLGIQFSYDTRMTHYQLDKCDRTTLKPTTVLPEIDSSTIGLPISNIGETTLPFLTTSRPTQHCSFESISVGRKCVRPLTFPRRSVQIAEFECKQKLNAELWDFDEASLEEKNLANNIEEGDEYWVNMENFRSQNLLASYFDFCPYITKEDGKVMLKDTFCHSYKGFFCQV